uniref:Interleukin-33 n=1 Tax=Canis lupus familiaris TaxID=9615 RepID=A0A8C0RKN0_CANLF
TKAKMKYSTRKIPPAKMNSSADKALVKSPKLRNKVLFRYYDSQSPSHETGDDVDGQTLLVNLSPTKDKDFLLHANNEEHSVELQKCENQLPDQAFFLLHRKSSECVSFECKNNPGVFIGVKDNHLALIKVGDQTKDSYIEKTIFKLSI